MIYIQYIVAFGVFVNLILHLFFFGGPRFHYVLHTAGQIESLSRNGNAAIGKLHAPPCIRNRNTTCSFLDG